MKQTTGRKAEAGPGARPRLARVAVFALLAVALAAAGACGDGAPAPAADVSVGTDLGERAPPLTGSRADGGGFELSHGGEATLVVFFRGFACGLCRERLREMQANLAEYGDAGVTLVAATPDTRENAERAHRDLGLGFDVVSVDSATVARWGLAPGERGLPLPGSYLVDRHGVVIYRHVGRNAADRARDLEVLAALREARGR